MNYYLRRSPSEKPQGPFSVEEINQRIAAGEVTGRWRATGDIGQPLEKVEKTKAQDWLHLSRVPGVQGISAPLPEISTRRPRKLHPIPPLIWAIMMAIVFLFFVGLLVLCYYLYGMSHF